jgi:hypothetical protein
MLLHLVDTSFYVASVAATIMTTIKWRSAAAFIDRIHHGYRVVCRAMDIVTFMVAMVWIFGFDV